MKTSRLGRILIRMDLMVYVIVSLIPFVGGCLLIGESSSTNEVSNGPPTLDEALLPIGIMLLILGIILLIVTYMKIKDTLETL